MVGNFFRRQINYLARSRNTLENALKNFRVVCVVLCLLIIPNLNVLLKMNETYLQRILIRDVCDVDGKDVLFHTKNKRALSIAFPDGTCEFTSGAPFPDGVDSDGVLIASYPASGMRLTWIHVEGLTEIIVGDDFDCADPDLDREGIIKTQYPHIEGIWSWGDNMRDVAYLIRNPRFAIPSYHTMISEIWYAHDCETAISYQDNLFSMQPAVENWTKWRDYQFHEELDLWRWHIDYWMGNGTKYWMDFDYERNGQYPFAWVPPEVNKTRDLNCLYQNLDCVPKVVIAYEYIIDPILGPAEVNKLAKLLENRAGFNVIEEAARPCIFDATLRSSPRKADSSRGDILSLYNFTHTQLKDMTDMIKGVKAKYSSDPWVDSSAAQDLCTYLELYIGNIDQEILDIETTNQYPPTPAPNEDYARVLKTWYESVGRGDRYSKAKVQAMYGYWPKVAHLYDDDT